MLGIDLYWLPLGAGGHSVRVNGRVFEALVALRERRPRCDLYHSALQVNVPEGRYVIEQAPAGAAGAERGVLVDGAVGVGAAGRFRLFRYEVRCWRDGVIPDIAEAVESPLRLSDDLGCARQLLELVPQVPSLVWGRDESGAGEMWNSNSVISWLIARSDLDVDSIEPPLGGRAPGWRAGIDVARRRDLRPGSERRRLPCVPVEADRLEALDRLLDHRLVFTDDAERAQREGLEVGAGAQNGRCLLLDE